MTATLRDRLAALLRRYDAYCEAGVSQEIFEGDGMYARGQPGAMEHYFSVGRSAIEVIAWALVAAARDEPIRSVLDLPCGAGRITRHLRAYFPEADLYAGELQKPCEDFVVEHFGALRASAPADFGGVSERTYDLIFVGSLVTHLDRDAFANAVRWFISAMAPNGVLVLTVHGRRQDYVETNVHRHAGPGVWDKVRADYTATGFGYYAYPKTPHYGVSLSKPSWVLKLVEAEPSARVIGYQEAGWSGHQDVLVLQKRPVTV